MTARTIGRVNLQSERRFRKLQVLPLEAGDGRPMVRGDCADGPRPCPLVSCAHNLYLDVNAGGGIKLNFPHLEVWELKESCSLDVADRGGATLEEVGQSLNVTRERVRQLAEEALKRLGAILRRKGIDGAAMVDEGESTLARAILSATSGE